MIALATHELLNQQFGSQPLAGSVHVNIDSDEVFECCWWSVQSLKECNGAMALGAD